MKDSFIFFILFICHKKDKVLKYPSNILRPLYAFFHSEKVPFFKGVEKCKICIMHFAFCTQFLSEARRAYPVHVSDCRIMQHPVNPVTLNFAPRRPEEGVELEGKLDRMGRSSG